MTTMDDDFIESIITTNPQTIDETMNRELYGMTAVKHSEEMTEAENEDEQ